jgi:HEAT repeat protein
LLFKAHSPVADTWLVPIGKDPDAKLEERGCPMGAKNGSTIAELIQNLGDADQLVRIHAATVLGSMGSAAQAAVPALITLLHQDDLQGRKLAALTLGEIGPVAEEAVPALFAAADDEDEGLSELAVWALEEVDLIESQEEAA